MRCRRSSCETWRAVHGSGVTNITGQRPGVATINWSESTESRLGSTLQAFGRFRSRQ